MDIMELLANILNPSPGQNKLVAPNANGPNYLTQTGLGPEQLARFHQMSGMGGQAAPPQSVAPQQAQMPDQQRTASVAPPQAQGGGILSRLFGGQNDGENQTIQWLQQQGMDAGTATMMAKSKPALQQYLLKRSQGVDPKDALQAEKLGLEIDQLRHPAAGSDWSKMDDGRLFNQKTGEIRDVGQPEGGGQFEGTSVEAQSLNYLVKNGQLTPDQAAQLGAGKTVTNPADGSLIFLTPAGVFGQATPGGPAQPLTPPSTQAAPAQPAVPSMPPGAPLPGPPGPREALDAAAGVPQPPATVPGNPGLITITGAKPSGKKTESEERYSAISTILVNEVPTLGANFKAMSDPTSQLLSKIPGGIGNMWQSEEYQRAASAVKTSVSSILYALSGASSSPGEVINQIGSLTPEFGDKPGLVADKLQRFKVYVRAVASGTGDPKLKAMVEDAIGKMDIPSSDASPTADGWREVAPGVKLRKVN